MSCGTSRYQLFKVTKLVYEEDAEYVALEVNLSKSGWHTMYKTIQDLVVLFRVSLCVLLHSVPKVYHTKHDVIRHVPRALSKVKMTVAW